MLQKSTKKGKNVVYSLSINQMAREMLDINSTNSFTTFNEEIAVHRLDIGAADVDAKPVATIHQAQPTIDIDAAAIPFPKEKLAALALLSKDEEYHLALKLAEAAQAMALLTMTWAPSANELLKLVESAITKASKKRIFTEEAHYFSLRRELDDLASAKGNEQILPQLIEAATTSARSNGQLPPIVAEYVAGVDWPGPLMMALARRYSGRQSSSSTLELAMDEYLQKIAPKTNINLPTDDKHRAELKKHIVAYLTARETLVTHNLRLVLHIAKRYAQQVDYLPDLIQEGACGLIRAAEKFRPATGNRFSTYAHQWIRSKVRAARANVDKIIATSHNYNNDLRRVSQWVDQQQTRHSSPYYLLHKLPEELNISDQRLDTMMQLRPGNLSLDQLSTDDEGPLLHGKIADPTSDFMDDFVNERSAQYLNTVMKKVLSGRECYILNERFGRLNGDPKTLQQVSDILGLSCERIRQLEASALKKLERWIDREAV